MVLEQTLMGAIGVDDAFSYLNLPCFKVNFAKKNWHELDSLCTLHCLKRTAQPKQ